MLEAFGVASAGAGLLSLAVQLFESSVKLRQYYSTFKNAPESLRNLTFEIDTLALLLQQIEDQRIQQDSFEVDLLDQCIVSCRNPTKRIARVAKRLALAIDRSKTLGCFNAALKQKDLEIDCRELESAKSSLTLAYLIHARYDGDTQIA